MMTTPTVASSVLPVAVLLLAVTTTPTTAGAAAATATAPASPATTYYASIVPYGPYPAPGFIVTGYLPKYNNYRIVSPVRYQPRQPSKPKYESDKYEDDEPKYYYGGKFKGVCSNDGLYYMDETSYVVCSNGYASYQPCPPGTKTDSFPSYRAGYYYGSSDLCSVNLVDFGYGPYSYMPQLISYDSDSTNSYGEQGATPYGPNQHEKVEPPKKDAYKPPDSPYDPPTDAHPTTYDNSASTTYHGSISYPPQYSYQAQPSDYPPHDTYVVDPPQTSHLFHSGDSYPPTGAYQPNKDTYPTRTDHDQSKDGHRSSSYQPRDTYSNLDRDSYYKPLPSHHSHPSESATYQRQPGARYDDENGHQQKPRGTYVSEERKN